MEFNQKKDGSCILNFSEEEIKIIQKKKKLYFTAETLRHFGNVLMRMVVEFNNNFDIKTSNIISNKDTVIIGKNKDDNKSRK